MIDSHCHLSFTPYQAYVPEVIARFKDRGGKTIVDIATHFAELEVNQKLIAEYPDVVMSAAGVHPAYLNPNGHEVVTELAENPQSYWKRFVDKYSQSRLDFIGETGIDRSELHKITTTNHQREHLDQQRWLFRQHVQLAQQDHKPLIIHSREASIDPAEQDSINDILAVLKEEHYTSKVIFHSFVYNRDVWQRLSEFDYFIGVNGVITYSNTTHIKEVIKLAPFEKLLLETDGPYLLPANVPPDERLQPKLNEPQFVAYIAKVVAKVRGVPTESVIEQTDANFSSLVSK